MRAVSVLAIIVSTLFLVSLPAGSGDTVSAKTVYFSAITLYHPIVMYQRYQPLMDYLTKNTPYKFELATFNR